MTNTIKLMAKLTTKTRWVVVSEKMLDEMRLIELQHKNKKQYIQAKQSRVVTPNMPMESKIAAALAGMEWDVDREAYIFARLCFCLEWNYLDEILRKGKLRFDKYFRDMRGKPLKFKPGTIDKMQCLAIYEITKPNTCPTCGGRDLSFVCPDCKGTGIKNLTHERRADLCGYERTQWWRTMRGRYENVYWHYNALKNSVLLHLRAHI